MSPSKGLKEPTTFKRGLALRLEPLFIHMENSLEKCGQNTLARKLRQKQHKWRGLTPDEWDMVIYYINAYIGTQSIVQREAAVSIKIQELKARRKEEKLSAAERSELLDLRSERARLDYHFREFNWGEKVIDSRLPEGPVKRALCSFLRNDRWYMGQWFRVDCVRKGGCCARGCGCCEKPRSLDREGFHGHCTGSCGCCAREKRTSFARTDDAMLDDKHFKLPFMEVKEDRDWDAFKGYTLDYIQWDPYSARMMDAYIWGKP